MKIECPTCKKESEWSPENKYRPFCSDRCRLIDLGEWFSEDRKIAGDDLTPSANSFANSLSPEDLALLKED